MHQGHAAGTCAALLVVLLTAFAPASAAGLEKPAAAAQEGPVATTRESAGARAEKLYRRALERFAEASPDSRRLALADFEEAARLEPGRSDIWLALGKACLEAGRIGRGRACLTRVARQLPDDFDAWSLLGLAWKRDWLASLERSSLDEAVKCFERAAAAAPRRAEGWSALAALTLARGRPRDALMAALRACEADPDGAEPLLALGAAFYRLGALAFADSAFRDARARLPAELRSRFDDGPTGPDQMAGGDASAAAGATAVASAWAAADPDLTTPENEAQLDYLTRLSLALFLFREGDEVRWDRRAELFVRYGPPASVEYDPAGAQVGWGTELEFSFARHAKVTYAPGPFPIPTTTCRSGTTPISACM